jgi:hypothetical protein
MFRPNHKTSDPVWLAAPLNRQHPLARNLVSFNLVLPGRFGGLTAYDLTDGTPFTLGSVTTWKDSIQRYGAWNFTGASGSSLESASQKFFHSGATLGQKLSLSIWYRTSVGTGNYGMISINNNAASSIFGLTVLTAAITVYTSGSTNSFASAFKNDGKWHNFIGTWDGATITAYQDGASLGTIAQSTAMVGTSRLTIGNRGAGSLFFNGDLDAGMFWNRTLNAAEAQMAWQEGLRGFPRLLNRFKRSYGTTLSTKSGLLLRRRREGILL